MAGHKNRRNARAREGQEITNRILSAGGTEQEAREASRIAYEQKHEEMRPNSGRKFDATLARHGDEIALVGTLVATVASAFPPVGLAVGAVVAGASAGAKVKGDLERREEEERNEKRKQFSALLDMNSQSATEFPIRSRDEATSEEALAAADKVLRAQAAGLSPETITALQARADSLAIAAAPKPAPPALSSAQGIPLGLWGQFKIWFSKMQKKIKTGNRPEGIHPSSAPDAGR